MTGAQRPGAQLADRWQRAISRTGAAPYSATEVRERLRQLLESALAFLADSSLGRESAAHIGAHVARIGYRTPEALGATLEVLSSGLAEQVGPDASARIGQLLGGIGAGFTAAIRLQVLDEQEASRAAVLAENRRAWDALRWQAALLDLAPDAILVRQIGSGRIVFWNRGAEALYGWRAEEVIGRSAHELLSTVSPRPVAEIEALVFQVGHWEDELVHRRRDGSLLTVSSRWAAQWDEAGRPLACLEINTDVTARKLIEDALREREASLEQAQSLAHLGSWVTDMTADTHYWSAEAYRLLGYGDREVPPTREMLLRALHPEDTGLIQQAVDAAMAGNSYAFEIRTAGRDGVERTLLCRNEVTRDAEGRPLKLVGTALDVTERKRAEAERVQLSVMQAARAEAEAARQRVTFLADASRVLAASLDYETTLRSVAHLAVPWLADVCLLDMLDEHDRLERVAWAHRPDLPPLTEPDSEQLARVLHASEAELHAASILVPLVSRGRAQGVISLLAAPTRASYGEIEAELAEELARRCGLAIDNARLHAEAQRATRLRDEFLSVAAHELKTPMTTLRGYAQWLVRPLNDNRQPDPVVLDRGLRAIDSQSAKLVDLTGQLLDVSRIEAGKLRLETREVDLVSLLRAVIDVAQSNTQTHTLSLTAPEELVVRLDALRFEQVISNLIDNAIKYSPNGGPIDVSVQPEERNRVRLAVRDHGLGIPFERRENLFDRFYQAHGEGHFGGLGLGLYICRQIVELHGGRISAEFPADGGSRFLISLAIEPPPQKST